MLSVRAQQFEFAGVMLENSIGRYVQEFDIPALLFNTTRREVMLRSSDSGFPEADQLSTSSERTGSWITWVKGMMTNAIVFGAIVFLLPWGKTYRA